MSQLPVSIVVTHTPQDARRRKFLADMEKSMGGVEEIRRRVLSYTVVTDVLEGNQRDRCNRICAERAWRIPPHPDATHVLQLQDDLAIAEGFLDAVGQCIEAVPDRIISFMTLRGIQRSVYEHGDTWMCGYGGLTGQAIMIPVPMIIPMWDWIDKWLPDVRYYDMPISTWATVHEEKFWFTVPSLVEHIGANESVIGHSHPKHVAGIYAPDVRHIDFRVIPDPVMNTGTMNHRAHYLQLLGAREDELGESCLP